jgi:hypothetical protein
MINKKALAGILGFTMAILFFCAPVLEAGHCRGPHCRRSSVSVNVGPVIQSPAYVVTSPVYEPVYVVQPAPVVVYQQPVYRPVYRPVYVAPQPTLFTGFSFNWFFR